MQHSHHLNKPFRLSSGFQRISDVHVALLVTLVSTLGMGLFQLGWHTLVRINTIEVDGYFVQAAALLRGEPYIDPYRPPLYTVAIAVLSGLTGVSTFVVANLISAIAYGLTIGLTYIVARRVLPGWWAVVAQLLVALNVLMIHQGFMATTDMLAALFALALLQVIVQIADRGAAPDATLNNTATDLTGFTRLQSRWQITLAGILAALLYLTRYNGVALALVCVLVILWISRSAGWWRLTSRLAGFGLVFAMICLPWWFYNTVQNGSPFANDNWKNVALSIYGDGDFSYLDRVPFTGLFDTLFHNPTRTVEFWLTNARDIAFYFLNRQMNLPFLDLFFFVGLYCVLRRNCDRWWVVGALALIVPMWLSFVYQPRLILALTPLATILALFGLEQSLTWLQARFPQLRPQLLHLIGIALLTITFALRFGEVTLVLPRLVDDQPRDELALVNWLLSNQRQQVILASPIPHLDYFVEHPERMKHVKLENHEPTFAFQTVARVASSQSDYVLLSRRSSVGVIDEMLAAGKIPACWQQVARVEPQDNLVLLYENRCGR
jgi:hypothetical protein